MSIAGVIKPNFFYFNGGVHPNCPCLFRPRYLPGIQLELILQFRNHTICMF